MVYIIKEGNSPYTLELSVRNENEVYNYFNKLLDKDNYDYVDDYMDDNKYHIIDLTINKPNNLIHIVAYPDNFDVVVDIDYKRNNKNYHDQLYLDSFDELVYDYIKKIINKTFDDKDDFEFNQFMNDFYK